MGIKDINDTIKKYYTYSQARLDCLAGRSMAIDFGTWMFKYWMPASKYVIMRTNLITEDPDPNLIRKTWFSYTQKGLLNILQSGVFPVFVFDGPSPDDKKGEKAKRYDAKIKSKNTYQQMISDARSSHDILDSSVDLTVLRKECVKAYSIPHEEYEYAMYLLQSLGFNVFKPNCEAEKFCSMLCIDGLVSAVYSSDTDNLAYGCPLWISDIEVGLLGEDYCTIMTYIQYDGLIQHLGITKDIFTDLCIMHGCDYNERIKGIGPVKACNLINQYYSIDNMVGIVNVSSLNHHRCRELFSYQRCTDLIDGNVQISYSSNIDSEVLDYYLSFYEATDNYISIYNGIEYCKNCTAMLMSNMI